MNYVPFAAWMLKWKMIQGEKGEGANVVLEKRKTFLWVSSTV
jgi:hypothetical protein